MKIAFLGSNEKEVQALNMYFLSLYKPKEEDLVGVIKTKCSYEYRYKNGDLVVIRILNPNVKGYKFNIIYYTKSLYINDNLNEDNMYYIYSTMIIRSEEDRNNKIIELNLEEIM